MANTLFLYQYEEINEVAPCTKGGIMVVERLFEP